MSFLIKMRMSMCAQELKWELEAMSVAERSDVLTFLALQYMTVFKPKLEKYDLMNRFPLLLTDHEAYTVYTSFENTRNGEILGYEETMKATGKKKLPGNLHHLFHEAQRRSTEVIMCSVAANVKGHEDIIKIWEMLPKEQKHHSKSIDRYSNGVQKLKKESPIPMIELIESIDKKLWERSCSNIFEEMGFV